MRRKVSILIAIIVVCASYQAIAQEFVTPPEDASIGKTTAVTQTQESSVRDRYNKIADSYDKEDHRTTPTEVHLSLNTINDYYTYFSRSRYIFILLLLSIATNIFWIFTFIHSLIYKVPNKWVRSIIILVGCVGVAIKIGGIRATVFQLILGISYFSIAYRKYKKKKNRTNTIHEDKIIHKY